MPAQNPQSASITDATYSAFIAMYHVVMTKVAFFCRYFPNIVLAFDPVSHGALAGIS
jgi:hypothetical protein